MLVAAGAQAVVFMGQIALPRQLPNEVEALVKLPPASEDVRPYVAVYALIGQSGHCCIGSDLAHHATGLGNLAIFMLTSLAVFKGSFSAARHLFTRTIRRITRAPFRYFDVTPTGSAPSLVAPAVLIIVHTGVS